MGDSRLGQERRQRGERSESRVVEAVRLAGLPWVDSVRRAPELDRDGIDIEVQTDVGPLYLQVKSSRRGAREFAAKHRKRQWVAVVVAGDRSLLSVSNDARLALSELRGRVLERRG